MNKEESVEPEDRKDISFQILEVKKDHYDKKDLFNILIKVEDKEFDVRFLMDSYNVIFFPEFKQLDKYHGEGGFKILNAFLESVYSKVNYYSQTQLNMPSRNRGIDSLIEKNNWDRETDEEEKEYLENRLETWVKKNSEYLVQYDLSKLTNKMIDEIVDYLEMRDEFVKPSFLGQDSEDIDELKHLLKLALEEERYEKAAEIREKLRQLK